MDLEEIKSNIKRTVRLIMLYLVLTNMLCSKVISQTALHTVKTDKAGAPVSRDYEVRNLLGYVDEHIGIGEGKCSLGVSLPFGSIRPCPHTRNAPRTGYNVSEKITGFTNVNTGMVNRYVNLLVSPQTGLDCEDEGKNKTTGHDSEKANEIVQPDYYAVDLTKFNIKTEISSTRNVAIYRFTYPKTVNSNASIVLYPSHTLGAVSTFSTVNYNKVKNSLTGYLLSNDGWYYAKNMKIYYAVKFSKPMQNYGVFTDNGTKLNDNVSQVSGNGCGFYIKFSTGNNEKVYMKIAISTKSEANAQESLDNEISDWNFDKVKDNATLIWNKALSSILIDDKKISADERKIFYTALYHTLISPKNRTGDCPWDYKGPYYDDQFCVWDTYRTEFPLLTLIKESVVRDNIQSYCEVFKHNGYAADALFIGKGDMIQGGDDVDVIVADAYVKGVKGINWTDAYSLLKGHATISGRTPLYKENDRGWVPFNSLPLMAHATASKTLEFAYNDFCLAQVAKGLNHKDDNSRFLNRSTKWANLWNPDVTSEGFSGFIQSKDSTSKWVYMDPNGKPDPFSKHFYEGNSWTYSFYAPHQMDKLMGLMGGKSTFVKRLQNYVGSKIDITNEPSFLTPYLFVYAQRPDLTSGYVRKLSYYFTNTGYPGDDDSGAMSSWLIFSKLGFFPVAGQDVYLINGPRYEKVIIQMENGKRIIINGKNASDKNQYIQSATMNGLALQQAWFKNNDIKNGTEISFTMGDSASNWGTKGDSIPSY